MWHCIVCSLPTCYTVTCMAHSIKETVSRTKRYCRMVCSFHQCKTGWKPLKMITCTPEYRPVIAAWPTKLWEITLTWLWDTKIQTMSVNCVNVTFYNFSNPIDINFCNPTIFCLEQKKNNFGFTKKKKKKKFRFYGTVLLIHRDAILITLLFNIITPIKKYPNSWQRYVAQTILHNNNFLYSYINTVRQH